jgi:hypothetical protein
MNYKNKLPWLTAGLKKSIKNKNKIFLKLKRTPTMANESSYKLYRNKLNSTIRKAERDNFDTLFNENSHNLKNSWKVIKQVINKNNKSLYPSSFYINDQSVADKGIIATNLMIIS